MPYIGKVKLSKNWTSVQSLVRSQVSGQSTFEFDPSATYQLQGEGNLGVRLCNATSIPTSDAQAGEIIKDTQCAMYKKDDSGILYAKVVYDGELTSDVLLKISSLGE